MYRMAILIKPEALTERVKIDKNMDIVQKTTSTPSSSNRIGTFGVDGRSDIGMIKFNANYFSATKTLQVTQKFIIDSAATTVTFGGHFYLVDGEPFNGYGRLEDGTGMEVLNFVVDNGYVEPFEIDVDVFNEVAQIRFWFDTSSDPCPWACYSGYGIGLRALADLIDFNSNATVHGFFGGEEIFANYIIVNPVTNKRFRITVNILDDYGNPSPGTIRYSQPISSINFLDGAWNPQNSWSMAMDILNTHYPYNQATTNELELEWGRIPMIYITTYRETIKMYLPCEGDGSSIEVYMDETGYISEWICN